MDLDKIAKLADLTLSDEEKKEFESELGEVVKFFDQLGEVNTDSVTPTSQTTGLTDVLRKDQINPSRIFNTEESVLNGKEIHNNYFVVDQVIDYDAS